MIASTAGAYASCTTTPTLRKQRRSRRPRDDGVVRDAAAPLRLELLAPSVEEKVEGDDESDEDAEEDESAAVAGA
jgi:hypothetical protein